MKMSKFKIKLKETKIRSLPFTTVTIDQNFGLLMILHSNSKHVSLKNKNKPQLENFMYDKYDFFHTPQYIQ